MKESILFIAEIISFIIAIIGVLVIVWGVAKAMLRFVHAEAYKLTIDEVNREHAKIRTDLGYYLLLGMEFLVAADIIHTVLSPQLMDLAVLGAIVAIRIVLSYFLQKELDHVSES